MTTEFKVGQVFKTFGFDNIVTITKITQKGKIYYINDLDKNKIKNVSILVNPLNLDELVKYLNNRWFNHLPPRLYMN